MTKPKVLVVAGHRSYNDAGNATEKSLTPAMASAYESALESAGYDVTHLQAEWDGDGDPDDTVGGLDTVGRKCGEWMAQTPGMVVMLDCHYEGSSAPGVFAIVPDKKHLGTAIRVPQPDDDQWENNTLDVRLARAISREISTATGLPLRATTEPGVMSETRTGVALQYSARLAMFAYTAPYRDRAVRLVVEHGSLPVESDREIIMRPDFTDKCAGAVVRAMNEVFGVAADVDPEPTEPEYADPAPIPFQLGVDLGWQKIGTTDVYSFVAKGTARRRVIKRAWAQDKAPVSGEAYLVGDAIVLCGYLRAADQDDPEKRIQWYLDKDGNRIRMAHVASAFRIVE